MKKTFINALFFCAAVLGLENETVIAKIGNKSFIKSDFFSIYPIEEWEGKDSLRRADMLYDWLKKELVFISARDKGFLNEPRIKSRIQDLEDVLIVNETYNHLVGRSLVEKNLIDEAMENLRLQVNTHHILISYNSTRFAQQVALAEPRNKDEAKQLCEHIISLFDSGSSFEDLAATFSDDPPAKQNFGALGWINWGNVPYDFQKTAFSLPLETISDPVLTEFGYHLILVTEKKPSVVANLNSDALEERAYNTAQRVVGIDRFRAAAFSFDSLALVESELHFNDITLLELESLYKNKNKTNLTTNSGKANPIPILESASLSGPLFTYNKKGFGALWYAGELKNLPPSQRPSLGDLNSVKNSIEVIVLRKLAGKLGKEKGVEESFSYRTQFKSKINDIIYEAYLKELVNSIENPLEKEVSAYYKKNIKNFYSQKMASVRDLRVSTKSLADSLLAVLNTGADFVNLASLYSTTNPDGGGLVEPFTKGRYNDMGVAAFELNPGEYSGVIANLDGSYSIVRLEDFLLPSPLGLDAVRTRIKTAIVRQKQEDIKIKGVRELVDSYDMWINPLFFNQRLVREKF